MVNTSPEPVPNISVSVLEDLTVAGLILLAVTYPVVTVVVVVVLVVAATAITVWLWRVARRAFRKIGAMLGRPSPVPWILGAMSGGK